MQEKIPFHQITPLESMKLMILEDGQTETWEYIDTIRLPLKRCQSRKLFAQAIKEIEKENE